MNTSKHQKGKSPFRDGLEHDPETASRKAFLTGDNPQTIKGENTVEGDVENDSSPTGGVPEHQQMRTNP